LGSNKVSIYDPLNGASSVDQENVTALRTNSRNGNVWVTLKLTNTQSKFTRDISRIIKTTEMQQNLFPKNYRISTFSLRDFLARVSALLEKGGDSTIRGEHYFLTSAGSFGLKDPAIVYLKTCKDYSAMTRGKHSRLSWSRWLNWGMVVNGRCLTANISGFPRIGKECSLSDILEKSPDQKYFLSPKSLARFERRGMRNVFRDRSPRETKAGKHSGTGARP